MEEIFEFLSYIYPSPACIEYLRKVVRSQKIAKGEIIPLRIGEVTLVFILSNQAHCIAIILSRTDPSPIGFSFKMRRLFLSAAFMTKLPSEDCIVAMEDTEVFYITKEQYDYACITFLEFNPSYSARTAGKILERISWSYAFYSQSQGRRSLPAGS